MDTIEQIAAYGPRESAGGAYRRAARVVGRRFRGLGYRVREQRFTLPAGTNDGIDVGPGETFNIVAEPAGFDPNEPHVVVGAHLDTTPDSPGANDNASGVAVVVELARMASLAPPRLPAVFVAFAGEERIRQSRSRSVYAEGSNEYVQRLSARRKRATVAMLNIDMVGSGSLRVMGESSRVVDAVVRAARRIEVDARRDTTFFYSDHLSFQVAGIPNAWLWTGDHPAFHTPGDRPSVIERRALRDTGDVAWETLRRLRAPSD